MCSLSDMFLVFFVNHTASNSFLNTGQNAPEPLVSGAHACLQTVQSTRIPHQRIFWVLNKMQKKDLSE